MTEHLPALMRLIKIADAYRAEYPANSVKEARIENEQYASDIESLLGALGDRRKTKRDRRAL